MYEVPRFETLRARAGDGEREPLSDELLVRRLLAERERELDDVELASESTSGTACGSRSRLRAVRSGVNTDQGPRLPPSDLRPSCTADGDGGSSRSSDSTRRARGLANQPAAAAADPSASAGGGSGELATARTLDNDASRGLALASSTPASRNLTCERHLAL